MKRRIIAVTLILLLAAMLVIPAAAQGVFVDGDNQKTVDANGCAFIAGQTPDSGGKIDGIAFVAGYDVIVSGTAEYIMGAGNIVTVSGSAQKDAFLAGNNVVVSGDVGRDAYIAGATVIISGKIGGDAYIAAEKLTIADGAQVAGTLYYDDSTQTDIAESSVIGGTDIYEVPQEAQEIAEDYKDDSTDYLGKLFGIVGLLAVAYILMALTGIWEKLDGKYTGVSFGKYAAAFGIGFAVLVGAPIATIILFITRIGIRAGLALLFVYAAAIAMAPAVGCYFIGRLIWRKAAKKAPNYWLELLIGIVLCRLVCLIPIVGGIVGFVFVCFGLGAFTLLLGKKSPKAQTPPLPVETPAEVPVELPPKEDAKLPE